MTEKPIEIFFSYSRQDEEFKNELVKRLVVLQRQGIVSSWNDRMIEPGSEWAKEIDSHLNSADIILLLVSPDFLASNYCWDVEVEKAMQRHAHGEAYVIPVILRWSNWEGTPFAKFQVLPRDARPIDSWDSRDEALYDVVQGIIITAESFRNAKRQMRDEERQAELHEEQRRAELYVERLRLEIEQRRQEKLLQAELQWKAAKIAEREPGEPNEQEVEQEVEKSNRQEARAEPQLQTLEVSRLEAEEIKNQDGEQQLELQQQVRILKTARQEKEQRRQEVLQDQAMIKQQRTTTIYVFGILLGLPLLVILLVLSRVVMFLMAQ